MILYTPTRFDSNEWFVICASLTCWSAVLVKPVRMPVVVWFGIWLFNVFLAQTVDFMVAEKPWNLYDINDHPQYAWFDVFLYALVYPPAGLLVIQIYKRLAPLGWRIVPYLILCASATLFLEWLSVLTGVFHYRGWQLAYSLPSYFAAYALNLAVYRYFMRWIHQDVDHR